MLSLRSSCCVSLQFLLLFDPCQRQLNRLQLESAPGSGGPGDPRVHKYVDSHAVIACMHVCACVRVHNVRVYVCTYVCTSKCLKSMCVCCVLCVCVYVSVCLGCVSCVSRVSVCVGVNVWGMGAGVGVGVHV